MSLKEKFEADQRKKFSGDGVTMDKQIVEDYIKSLGLKKDAKKIVKPRSISQQDHLNNSTIYINL